MTENQIKFLSTLFNPDEEVYASPDKYSSSWDEEKQNWKIYRPSVKQGDIAQNTNLIGINPISGIKRNDANVTAYRNFLVEMDNASLQEQMDMVEKIGLPYSLCVFSGGKSLHFAIALNESLPSEEVYRFYAEWLLKTLPEADQATKNPSRAIRFPDVKRNDGDKKQLLVKVRERITLNKLRQYLSAFPDKRPVEQQEKELSAGPISDTNVEGLAKWVRDGMDSGFDFGIGRNNRWFSIGVEFAKCGFSIDDTILWMDKYYTPEPSFTRREWKSALKSGYKHGKQKFWK